MSSRKEHDFYSEILDNKIDNNIDNKIDNNVIDLFKLDSEDELINFELKCDNNFKSSKERTSTRVETCHPIFVAIYNFNYDLLCSELESLSIGAINYITYAGQSLLHAACEVRNIHALKKLLHRGAKVTVENSVGNTPLHTAVSNSWIEGIEELLSFGSKCNTITGLNLKLRGIERQSPLHLAVKLGNLQIVKIILENNPCLSSVDGDQNTLLHLAAYSQNVSLINVLLSYEEIKESLNCLNDRGETPLHTLLKSESNDEKAEEQIIKIVEILMQEGININSGNSYLETPLFLTCSYNLPKVTNYLLKVGADPTIITTDGRSSVHASCQSGSHECLKLLIKSGKVGNLILKEDYENLSPFHYAVKSYSIDCCELLFKNGDHLSNTDNRNITRCSSILSNLPNAHELLTRIFDSNTKVSRKSVHDPLFSVTFNYSPLLCNRSNCVQNSIIRELVKPRFEILLKHPLLESFLYIKWRLIRPYFYAMVFNYFLFIVIHTYFIMKTYGGTNAINWSLDEYFQTLMVFRTLHVILFFLILVPDLVLMIGQFPKFLTQIDTYVKAVTIVTSAFILFMPMEKYDILCQRNIAAISVMFGWFGLMLLFGKLPTFGVYILMFMRISKSIIKFLIAFSFILLGYSCAFEIVFYEVDSFKTLPLTILKTLMMMIGEIDYLTIYQQGNLTRLFEKGEHPTFHLFSNDILRLALLISFLFLVPILMANLLIGLAVSNIPDLVRQGKIRRLAKQASYIVSYEKLMRCVKNQKLFPCVLRKLLFKHYKICCEVALYPNKKDQNVKRHLRLNPEIIEGAIMIHPKNDAINELFPENDDIKTQFFTFQKQYCRDRKCFEKQLSKVENSTRQLSSEKDVLECFQTIRQELLEQRVMIQNLKNKLQK
ncbi:UNVERIFIED_CONTAM: hypothetical protein RMT77_011452 [Armadillidium vulgare]